VVGRLSKIAAIDDRDHEGVGGCGGRPAVGHAFVEGHVEAVGFSDAREIGAGGIFDDDAWQREVEAREVELLAEVALGESCH